MLSGALLGPFVGALLSLYALKGVQAGIATSIIAFFPKYQFGAVMLWNCESPIPMGIMPMLLDRYLGLPAVDWAGVENAKHEALMAGGSR